MPTALHQEWLDRLGGAGRQHSLADARELFPEIHDAYTPPDFTATPSFGTVSSDADGEISVFVTYRLTSLLNNETGIIDRTFSTRTGWANHKLFDLPEASRDHYRGRLTMRKSARLYENLGIEKVKLTAIDIGRYVWAMCGFDFEPLEDDANEGWQDDRTIVLNAASQFAEALGRGLSDEDIARLEHPWQIGALESDAPISLYDVALAQGENPQDLADVADDLAGEEIRLGKALLLYAPYSQWNGVLDLGHESIGKRELLRYTEVGNGD
jgi:hypothetical protein